MEITNIAKKINILGGKIYLVGGALRDELMGEIINDEDYCITGITTSQFKKIFPKINR